MNATPLTWTFDHRNPVIVPGQLHGSLDGKRTASGNAVRVGDRYRLYYWGHSDDGVNRVFAAEAPVDDLSRWRGLGPMLEPQPDYPYNAEGPVIPSVLPLEDQPWLMFLGTNARRRGDEQFWWYSAAAESHDRGLTWRYLTSEPLIVCDRAFDRVGTGTVFVFHEDGVFHMYYTACGRYVDTPAPGTPLVGIAYARSTDGRTWDVPFDDWIIPPRTDLTDQPETWIAKPHVLREPTPDGSRRYRMWVSAKQHRYAVRSLVSTDLIHWSWVDCDTTLGDLGVGEAGRFDDQQRTYAGVVVDGDHYRMWYSGNNYGSAGIGMATAPIPKA